MVSPKARTMTRRMRDLAANEDARMPTTKLLAAMTDFSFILWAICSLCTLLGAHSRPKAPPRAHDLHHLW